MNIKVVKNFIVHRIFLVILPATIFLSCFQDQGDFSHRFYEGEIEGYAPIYATEEETEIKITAARALENPAKIYVYGDWLLINERMKGVHIIDNSDPHNPINKHFLQVAGNVDMAIKDGVLIVDQSGSMISIDMRDPENPILGEKLENVFDTDFSYPAERGVYFECVDPTKGIVVGWELKVLSNPKCYR